MVRLIAGLHARIRHLVPELAKFGAVGGIGAVIDLGGAAMLHSAYHQGPLKAKATSFAVAMVVTYVGSRYWTFRHRENQSLLREGTLFAALNLVGLVIAELVIAFTTYVLVLKGPVSYNLASLAGTGLGTIFRYLTYRKWVFLAPAAQSAPATASPPAFVPHPARSAPAAVASDQAPPLLDLSHPHQPPSWSRRAPSRAAQVTQAPSRARRPTAQATMTPSRHRSSGGRHRKPRSA
jgi:putative flippase GtrA